MRLMMTTRKSHKARGATFESDIRDWFRANGYDAERLARTGARDEGDVVVRSDFLGSIGIIECKAPGAGNKVDLSGWSKEAQLEAQHYADARELEREKIIAALVIKARGKSIADAYLVLRLGDVFGE
jgi:glycine cleavage system aminomethyltransferase T